MDRIEQTEGEEEGEKKGLREGGEEGMRRREKEGAAKGDWRDGSADKSPCCSSKEPDVPRTHIRQQLPVSPVSRDASYGLFRHLYIHTYRHDYMHVISILKKIRERMRVGEKRGRERKGGWENSL